MVYDLRTYKIPNKLCVAGILTGLSVNIILYGGGGFRSSVLGICCPVAVLFVFFLLRIIGAGDIKLLSAIGAFIAYDVLKVIIATFVIAGAYSLIYVIVKLIRWVVSKRSGTDVKYSFSRMHLSAAIFAANIVYLLSVTGAFGFGGILDGI